MKKCSRCGEEKSLDEFCKSKNSNDGKYTICNKCKNKIQNIAKHKYPEKFLFYRAKCRAKKNGIPFDLKLEDLKIPKVCPVFKKSFVYMTGKQEDFSVSLDRIDNTKGYIKENIIIVSWLANKIKSTATPKEIQAVATFYKKLKES